MSIANATGTQILNLQALDFPRAKTGNSGQKIRKPRTLIVPFKPE
jgi:hypothetical protein